MKISSGSIDMISMDDIVQVTDQDCFSMARRLNREEGLFVGGSSGAAVAGAMAYVKKFGHKFNGRKPNIVTIMCDNHNRYLSKVFNDEWMQQNGFEA